MSASNADKPQAGPIDPPADEAENGEWGTGQLALDMETPPGPEIVLSGRQVIYFGGTGYYCLQGHPEVIDAATAATRQYGIGTATAGTKPVGPSPIERELERTAAEFFGTEDAVCLPSGYMCNAVGMAGLAGRCDRLFVDATSHYSVFDAARLSGIPVSTFAHRDARDLERQLGDHLRSGEIPLLVSDGVFPTFGEIAPVDTYLEVLAPYEGVVWLDDAHAVGVLGPNGRGTFDYHGLSGRNLYFAGSLAKAIGGHGGVIPGSSGTCNRLRGTSSMLRGASRISVPNAAASTAGLKILMREPERRARLLDNARTLKTGLRALGISTSESPHPVAAFSLGSSLENLRVHHELMRRGILVPFATYVGAGDDGVVRIVVFSEHTSEHIARLLSALKDLVPCGNPKDQR